MVAVLLVDDTTSSNVMHGYEFNNETSSRRYSPAYDYQFENRPGPLRAENFYGKSKMLDKHEYEYLYVPDTNTAETYWNGETQGRMIGTHVDESEHGNTNAQATITIEQFVAELKKRIQEKELQKQKNDKLDVKLTGYGRTKKIQKINTTRPQKIKQRNKSIKMPSHIRKVLEPVIEKPKGKNVNKGLRGKTQNKQSSKNIGTNKPKISPILRPKKIEKRRPKLILPPKTKQSQRQPVMKIPPKKIIVKPTEKRNQEAQPSRKQKPFHKPKNDIINRKRGDKDLFQIGSSDPHQQSDNHLHQHDHLEAHKHHHKHQDSHSHDHAHANDHVHNHKHTHNHVHNHIHKHNEAHEHSAEHTHTEKHQHKHLEYIDAGGWRRSDTNKEAMDFKEPVSLSLLSRENSENRVDVEDLEKQKLEKYIDVISTDRPFSDSVNSDPYKDYEPFEEYQEAIESPHMAYNDDTSIDTYDNRERGFDFNVREKFPENHEISEEKSPSSNEYFVTPYPSPTDMSKERNKLMDLIPEDQKNKYPVEVEEITYEEYLELQKMGDTFEEPIDEYDEDFDKESRFSNSLGSTDFNGYSDQTGYGTNNNYVRVKYDGAKEEDKDLLFEKIRMIPENEVLRSNNKFGTILNTIPANEIEKMMLLNQYEGNKIRFMSQMNPFEKSNFIHKENEVAFETQSGFETIPMVFTHNNENQHEIAFENQHAFQLVDEPTARTSKMFDGNDHKVNSNDLIAQNRMDYDTEDYYYIEDVLNRTDTSVEYVTPLPVANNDIIAHATKRKNVDDAVEKQEFTKEEEEDYKEYYDELLAMYTYDDFDKLQQEKVANITEDVSNNKQSIVNLEVTAGEGLIHNKYDLVEPRPVYVVYPVTEEYKETKTITTEETLYETSTAKIIQKNFDTNNTHNFSIDYNNFL